MLHFIDEEGLHGLLLGSWGFDQKLIVHLQHDTGCIATRTEGAVHLVHRLLHDVGGTALDRRVHRDTLTEAAAHEVRGIDVRHRPTTPEDRLHIAVLMRERHLTIEVLLDIRIRREVALDVLLRLTPADAEAFTETEGRDTVDDTEVDRLRVPTKLRRHLLERYMEDLRGRHGMNIARILIRCDQLRITRERCKDTELDLRIVGVDEDAAWLRHENGAEASTKLRTHRDVLQVRIRRRDTARRRHHLIKLPMDAAIRLNKVQKPLRIGRVQLRKRTVVQDIRHDLVVLGELLKHIRRG